MIQRVDHETPRHSSVPQHARRAYCSELAEGENILSLLELPIDRKTDLQISMP